LEPVAEIAGAIVGRLHSGELLADRGAHFGRKIVAFERFAILADGRILAALTLREDGVLGRHWSLMPTALLAVRILVEESFLRRKLPGWRVSNRRAVRS